MKHHDKLREMVPGLFDDNGILKTSVHISPELFQEHLDIAAGLPRNVKKLSAQCHKGYLTVTAEVSRGLTLFLNIPSEFVFTVSIEEFLLSSEKRRCVLRLNGPVAERGRSFIVQLAVTLVEDLVIFLLRGKRERYACQFTESRMEWPRVEVNLDSIDEVEDIAHDDGSVLWEYITISEADITEKGISVPVREVRELA